MTSKKKAKPEPEEKPTEVATGEEVEEVIEKPTLQEAEEGQKPVEGPQPPGMFHSDMSRKKPVSSKIGSTPIFGEQPAPKEKPKELEPEPELQKEEEIVKGVCAALFSSTEQPGKHTFVVDGLGDHDIRCINFMTEYLDGAGYIQDRDLSFFAQFLFSHLMTTIRKDLLAKDMARGS